LCSVDERIDKFFEATGVVNVVSEEIINYLIQAKLRGERRRELTVAECRAYFPKFFGFLRMSLLPDYVGSPHLTDSAAEETLPTVEEVEMATARILNAAVAPIIEDL
jgi:hypothetical protein